MLFTTLVPWLTGGLVFFLFPTLVLLFTGDFKKKVVSKPPTPSPPHLKALPLRSESVPNLRENWLKGKQLGDNLVDPKLWKIHGQYYDLSSFEHPGGKEWLDLTRGTDCTEAFEVHHIEIKKVSALLPKYLVKSIPTEEGTRFTFEPKGFYSVLREKIAKKIGKNRGPTEEMKLATYIYVSLWSLSFLLTCITGHYLFAVIAGFLLGPIWGIGHNYLHQKETKLKYIFDLTLCNSYEWRLSHAISHHLYTNSQLDFEIEGLEPFAWYLSSAKRPLSPGILSMAYYQVFFALTIVMDYFTTFIVIPLKHPQSFRIEKLIPIVQLIFLTIGTRSLTTGVGLWFVMHSLNSFWLLSTSFCVHHQPDSWHDGDPHVRNRDYGEHILASTRDHTYEPYSLMYIMKSLLFWGYLNEHTVHHLFPTIDHSRIASVREELFSTVKEFNLKCEVNYFPELYRGIWKKLLYSGSIQQ
eukprot:TRINITY_DN1172_c2_g1_i1.p1 TRINITY_DN1172_c2_g1~~TRINITY_DN1172_c2_g1_i1.p1  ORF type:complete len:467 (+),score=39.87 TRINITY_DN1172_c2_g1_i1:90-1490(+)